MKDDEPQTIDAVDVFCYLIAAAILTPLAWWAKEHFALAEIIRAWLS
jgi:hypothetical protein